MDIKYLSMKVLKPNGIILSLYAEFKFKDKNFQQHKKPVKALLFFNFLNLSGYMFVNKFNIII